jgi:hypothetical protein
LLVQRWSLGALLGLALLGGYASEASAEEGVATATDSSPATDEQGAGTSGAASPSTAGVGALSGDTHYVAEPVVDERAAREERERREEARLLGQAHLSIAAIAYGGTRLSGTGSLGRYGLGTGAIELDADRYFDWLGVGVHLGFFPAAGTGLDYDAVYARIEGSLGAKLATWRGPAPGGVAVGVGLGGDFTPAWFADEWRFYPLLRAKARWWLSSEVPLQLGYTALPAVAGKEGLSMHEHRWQIGSGYGLLGFGTRLGVAFVDVDTSQRSYFHHEVGAYVSVGVFE